MTDAAFLYHVLEDGKWHGQAEIIARSITERGCGLTVHSRAADLRKKGCIVECELRRNGHGRALSYYRLVALDEAAESVGEDHAAVSSSVPAVGAPHMLAGAPSLLAEPAGTLELFACAVDESAGMRGAYGDEAA